MKLALQLLVLTNAMLLALPPNWCCTLRLPGKHADSKPQCCAQQEPAPEDGEQDEQRPTTVDCCCQIDSSLPPHPEIVARDLASSPVVTVSESGDGVSVFDAEAVVAIAEAPPLQILHCVWIC
jgi:hypothetical protein